MGTRAFECGFGSVQKNSEGPRICPDLDLGGLQIEVDGSGGGQMMSMASGMYCGLIQRYKSSKFSGTFGTVVLQTGGIGNYEARD